MNARIKKKLNRKARDYLINTGQFNEDDFSNCGTELYLFSQSECGDEYDECEPYNYIAHTAYILATDFNYDTITGEYNEKLMFKIRNPRHVFKLNYDRDVARGRKIKRKY